MSQVTQLSQRLVESRLKIESWREGAPTMPEHEEGFPKQQRGMRPKLLFPVCGPQIVDSSIDKLILGSWDARLALLMADSVGLVV